jgi:hypothetical protein
MDDIATPQRKRRGITWEGNPGTVNLTQVSGVVN